MAHNIMRFDTIEEREAFYDNSLEDIISYVDDDDEPHIRIAPRDEIWYTSTDGDVVTPYLTSKSTFGANIVSNTYTDGKGIIKFDGPVTKVGGYAFYNRSKLSSIAFPESVTEIGSYALRSCSKLSYIFFPENLLSIGSGAFYNVSLQQLYFNDNFISIGDYAFQWSGSVKKAYFGKNITSIGNNIFNECSGLVSISVDADNPVYDSREGCNAIIETATNTMIAGCKKTVIPTTVTSIASTIFSYTGITKVELPSNITSLGTNPFRYNGDITTITVDPDNPVYDSRDNCNAIIETATNTLVSGCKNTIIPNTVTALANNCLYAMGLTRINIPSSVISIHYNSLVYNNWLSTITVDPDNPVYDSRDNCNAIIETATNTLIAGCKGTTIPYGVEIIGAYAFYLQTEMTTITLPETVTSIGADAFTSTSKLSSFTSLNPTPPTLASNSISGINATCNFYVPAASVEAYKAAPYWSARAAYIQTIS